MTARSREEIRASVERMEISGVDVTAILKASPGGVLFWEAQDNSGYGARSPIVGIGEVDSAGPRNPYDVQAWLDIAEGAFSLPEPVRSAGLTWTRADASLIDAAHPERGIRVAWRTAQSSTGADVEKMKVPATRTRSRARTAVERMAAKAEGSKEGLGAFIDRVGGQAQLNRAATELIAAPRFGLSAAEIRRLIARHEQAFLAQAERGFLRQHDPKDLTLHRALAEKLKEILDEWIPDTEPTTRALLKRFHVELCKAIAGGEYRRSSTEWIARLDVMALFRHLEKAHVKDAAIRRSGTLADPENRKMWFKKWTNWLIVKVLDPQNLTELKYQMIGRLVDAGFVPQASMGSLTLLDRDQPQHPDYPDLYPLLADYWLAGPDAPDEAAMAAVRGMGLNLNSLISGLVEEAGRGWTSDPQAIRRILARIVIWLCDEVEEWWVNPTVALAGRVLRIWHAHECPRSWPSQVVSTELYLKAGEAMERAGFAALGPPEGTWTKGAYAWTGKRWGISLPELLSVLRLELEVNLTGHYAFDRINAEFATVDVLVAIEKLGTGVS